MLSQTKKLTYWFGNDHNNGIEKTVEVLVSDTSIFDGKYTLFFQNGCLRIEGFFKNNKPVGLWKYNYESGVLKQQILYTSDTSSYRTYFFENGLKKKEGNIINDKKAGKWSYYYEKGTVLKQGYFINGLKDKQWDYFFEDGQTKAVAMYKNGAGVYTEYYFKGAVKMSGPVIANVSNGVWSYYYKTGKLKSKGFEKNGVKDGYWEYFYKNDSLASKGNYVNGIKQGDWKFYHENGVLSSEGVMTEGIRDGYWKLFNQQGGFKADATLLNGTGVYKEYYDNNKLKIDGYLKDDKNHGPWVYFYDDGVVEGRADYTNGKGEYLGYYQSGELKMKGQIHDGKQVGTWELYDKKGEIIGYYKLGDSNPKEGVNLINEAITDNNPPPMLSSDSIESHKMPHFKMRRRNVYRPFRPRSGESKGFIIGINPLAIVANQIPVSIEYFIQERLGYELRYTIRRNPFFVPDNKLNNESLFLRGYSIDLRQKFYSRFKQDRGMFYFDHEFRYVNQTYFYYSNDKSELSKLLQNKFEYAWVIGDRVLGNIRYGGLTFDIYAGLGLSYVVQKRDIVSGQESKFLNIGNDKLQLATRLGFTLGYLF